MSSAPSGLDVREYSYGTFDHTVGPDLTTLTARGRWLITRMTFWASSAPNCRVALNRESNVSNIAPNGCLELEPNGAYRAEVQVRGEGMRCLIEYWWLPTEDGLPPTVTVLT